ncbi:MAG TPA: response regulator [Opitutaceae bacterium]|nr:response regulator [Opitutaceae bacterium]
MPDRTQRAPLLRNLPIAGAVVLLLLGGSVLAGWFTGVRVLVTWRAAGTAAPAGALSLMIFALALYARARLGRRWALVALPPALAGLWSLLARAGVLPPGIDALWLGPVVAGEAPVRLSAAGAAGFVLAGAALGLLALERAVRLRVAVLACVGSLVGAAGLAAVLGHATALTAATTLGLGTPISGPMAVGLLVLGCCLVGAALEERPVADGPARWLPVPLMGACVGAALIVTVALRARETAQWRAALEAQSAATVAALVAELDGPSKALARIAAHEAAGGAEATALRAIDARALVRDYPEVERVWWLDAAFVPRLAWGENGEATARPFDHLGEARRRAALVRLSAQGDREVLISSTDSAGRPGLMFYVPIRHNDSTEFLAAQLRAAVWIERALARLPAAGRAEIAVAIEGETVFGEFAEAERARAGVETEGIIHGQRVRLTLYRESEPGLAPVVLVTGVVFAALLGLVVDLAQKARNRELLAHEAAGRLVAEDLERRKVEARLKASEERLGLALQAGQVGTFDWDQITGEAHFSGGAWRMLGYEAAEKTARMAEWDNLIHRDDAGAARREFPRGPQPAFREAEYRVRNAHGEWRWILERSKAVAFDNDGAARRVAGTFQDITARRQAEESLRVSQAEARKLAIVASATESLVVITDEIGTVEWVNDSLVRHTGCPRTAALGRALSELFPPPEGEAAPPVALREAFVRRLPARVEVATVSREGRRFHLAGEVRPVAGERGEIEKYIAVLHDVTARIETERALREAKLQAEEATRAKSDFLASMSHEIRTPMNGVIGLARLLLESPLSSEQRDWVETIRRSGDGLMTIINDILDFSKIESGRMELERYSFSPAECVEEALELFAVAAGQKGLALAYCMAPGVAERITGDAMRLRQVLVNLVSNAVKFTSTGRIGVEVRPGAAPDQVEFAVADTGIGIPAERAEVLFQPFSQVDASTTRRFGGTGLGLAICRRLVELMGGEIGVTSRAGEGTVFRFTITAPAAPASLEEERKTGGGGKRVAVVDDDPVAQRFLVRTLEAEGYLPWCFDSGVAARQALGGGAAPDLLVIDRTSPGRDDGLAAARLLRGAWPGADVPVLLLTLTGQTAPREELAVAGVRAVALKPLRRQVLLERVAAALAGPAAGAAPVASEPVAAPAAKPVLAERIPLRVLLAEDNPVNKKVALRLLERLGYSAQAVGNGNEAVRAVCDERYDLVFMDVQMPELDGLEATRRIRATVPPERQPVIVALTANAIAGDAELCRAAGMDDYVSKPVTPEDIFNVIVRRFGAGRGIEPLKPGANNN